MFKKNKFLTFISFLSITFGISLRAQEASFMPLELIAEPGESKTNNISSGQSESLRVGTTSSFGANVSVSSSSGYLTEATSSVKLSKVVLFKVVSVVKQITLLLSRLM